MRCPPSYNTKESAHRSTNGLFRIASHACLRPWADLGERDLAEHDDLSPTPRLPLTAHHDAAPNPLTGSHPLGSVSPEGTFAQTPEQIAASATSSKEFRELPGYEILDELGRGGMGVVFRARDKKLNRVVALKMILRGDATPQTIARFWAEAEVMAAVKASARRPGV